MRQFLATQEAVLEVRRHSRGSSPRRTVPQLTATPQALAPARSQPSNRLASSPLSPALVTPTPPQRTNPAATPLLREVLLHEPGVRLIAECEFDPRTDRFLLDHAFFGRRVSRHDADLTALPVMPLAMML